MHVSQRADAHPQQKKWNSEKVSRQISNKVLSRSIQNRRYRRGNPAHAREPAQQMLTPNKKWKSEKVSRRSPNKVLSRSIQNDI